MTLASNDNMDLTLQAEDSRAACKEMLCLFSFVLYSALHFSVSIRHAHACAARSIHVSLLTEPTTVS